MIYLILPVNRNKLNNKSDSKLWYKYFDINMNISVVITKLKTIHWIMLKHGLRNGLYVLCNGYNTTITKLFIST